MKIGILTYHRAVNYGAYLQACALCGRLGEESGIDAEIIDFRMNKEVRRYDVRTYTLKQKLARIKNGTYFFEKEKYASFMSAWNDPVMKKSAESMVSDSIDDFAAFVRGKYDVIVAGSDEVWKVNNFRGFPSPYFLPGDLGCRKFSYAASARVKFDEVLSAEDHERLRGYLSDFEWIGVRDAYTGDEVEKVLGSGSKVHMCCDPTFLYDFKVPDMGTEDLLMSMKGYDPKKKTVMVMIDSKEEAEALRRGAGDRYNLVSVFHRHKGYINISGLTPMGWLSLIDRSDMVAASFFHAVCFSIIRNRPFVAIGTRGKKSKLEELLTDERLRARYLDAEGTEVPYGELLPRFMVREDFGDIVAEKRKTFEVFSEALKKQ
ncbi:MAG: polysaccharide pyruvyl transferase family protein [Lachnospiraceae bacterium]|nr:polysaccharide pyruvyl transferase family protein [Lachnospiraceae bacterium]